MTTPDPSSVPEEFRSWVRGTGGREFEFISERDQLGKSGDIIPDYWFVAHNAPDREGVQIAADYLRPYLPNTADAITENTTHIRIARFALTRGGSADRVGLFYIQPAKSGALGMVGFPPARRPKAVPKFWDQSPSALREFNTTVHDGFVEDHWYDNGIDSIENWMTLEEYASLTGIFENLTGPIQASDVNHQGIPIEQAPRPPEMGVVGHNGRHVAYMFEIDHAERLAWSFGDEYVMQEEQPILGLIDSVIAMRTASSS